MPDASLFDESIPFDIKDWCWMISDGWGEFKREKAYDAFVAEDRDKDDNIEGRTIDHDVGNALDTQGQIAMYATMQLARQHRMFAFSFLICGSRARFIRWDRGGAIVTRSFDYVKQPEILTEYLWRYGQMTPIQRGLDPTARSATTAEADRLAAAVNVHISNTKLRQIPKMADTLSTSYRAYCISVSGINNDGKSETREYIVQKPIVAPSSPVGRSTRVYYALDTQSNPEKLVCLKDYWRPNDNSRPAESVIYARLNAANVRHLPDVLLSGDVPIQPSDDIAGRSWQETYTDVWLENYKEAKARREVQKAADEMKEMQPPKDVEMKSGKAELSVADMGPPAADAAPNLVYQMPEKLCLTAPLRSYRHHRVVQDLLYPLSSAKDAMELVKAVRNAVVCESIDFLVPSSFVIDPFLRLGVNDAYKADVLHRDVSEGNIMLDKDGQGVLNDWDHAVIVSGERKVASRRTVCFCHDNMYRYVLMLPLHREHGSSSLSLWVEIPTVTTPFLTILSRATGFSSLKACIMSTAMPLRPVSRCSTKLRSKSCQTVPIDTSEAL